MSDSNFGWESLRPFLYSDAWSVVDALWIFAGFVPHHDTLVSVATGESIPEHSAKRKIGEAYANRQILKDIWVNSTHPFDETICRSYNYANLDDCKYDKYYCLFWALRIPLIQLDWLEWAYEKNYLNKVGVNRIEKLLHHNVVQLEIDAKPTEESKGYENLLRLTGVLREMLADPKVIQQLIKDPETFKKTGDLANYIGGAYGKEEHFINKGLSAKISGDRFADAKKILKSDRQ